MSVESDSVQGMQQITRHYGACVRIFGVAEGRWAGVLDGPNGSFLHGEGSSPNDVVATLWKRRQEARLGLARVMEP